MMVSLVRVNVVDCRLSLRERTIFRGAKDDNERWLLET